MSYYLALNLILSLIHSYIQSTIIQCAGTVLTPRHPAENPVLALREFTAQNTVLDGHTRPARRGQGRLPGGGAPWERNREERTPPSAPMLRGREAALCGREPGGKGGWAWLQRRAELLRKGQAVRQLPTRAPVLITLKSVVLL